MRCIVDGRFQDYFKGGRPDHRAVQSTLFSPEPRPRSNQQVLVPGEVPLMAGRPTPAAAHLPSKRPFLGACCVLVFVTFTADLMTTMSFLTLFRDSYFPAGLEEIN